MTMRRIVKAFTSFENAVSQTMQQQVIALVDACTAEYAGDDVPKADVLAIQDAVASDSKWKGSSSEGVRRSEIKACLTAYPYYFGEACTAFRKDFGELRRNHMLAVARELPKHEEWRDAVTTVVKRMREKAKKVTSRKPTIGMGLGIIKNLQTRSRKIIAFRKELAVLCAKYDISY